MLGFTYDGVHSDEMKLKYAPNESNRITSIPTLDVTSTERNWYDGADWFNSRLKSREFELTCYYEEITTKELNRILAWFDRRTYGDLIFDDRPYVAYKVRPSKEPVVKDYPARAYDNSYRSGTLSVKLKCFTPTGRLIYTTSDSAPSSASNEVDLLPSSVMPVYNKTTTALVYNPGTEYGHSVLTLSGATTGNITITNNTTGTTCTINGPITARNNEVYKIESKTGRCYWYNQGFGSYNIDFAWHNNGYLKFAPNKILIDNIKVTTTKNSSNVTASASHTTPIGGAYIYIDNTWKKIIAVNGNTITISGTASSTGTVTTKVVTMNELAITGNSNINGSLSIDCVPEVS